MRQVPSAKDGHRPLTAINSFPMPQRAECSLPYPHGLLQPERYGHAYPYAFSWLAFPFPCRHCLQHTKRLLIQHRIDRTQHSEPAAPALGTDKEPYDDPSLYAGFLQHRRITEIGCNERIEITGETRGFLKGTYRFHQRLPSVVTVSSLSIRTTTDAVSQQGTELGSAQILGEKEHSSFLFFDFIG